MARRLLSSRAHADLFEVPTEPDALIRHYLLSGDDIDLIRTRRRAENLLSVVLRKNLPMGPKSGAPLSTDISRQIASNSSAQSTSTTFNRSENPVGLLVPLLRVTPLPRGPGGRPRSAQRSGNHHECSRSEFGIDL